MVIAKIRVNDAIARTVYRKAIPAGIIGAQVEFDYADDIWHGLRKQETQCTTLSALFGELEDAVVTHWMPLPKPPKGE